MYGIRSMNPFADSVQPRRDPLGEIARLLDQLCEIRRDASLDIEEREALVNEIRADIAALRQRRSTR